MTVTVILVYDFDSFKLPKQIHFLPLSRITDTQLAVNMVHVRSQAENVERLVRACRACSTDHLKVQRNKTSFCCLQNTSPEIGFILRHLLLCCSPALSLYRCGSALLRAPPLQRVASGRAESAEKRAVSAEQRAEKSGDRAETEEEIEAEIGKHVLKTQSGLLCSTTML